MKHKHVQFKRRAVLKGLAAIPVAVLVGHTGNVSAEMLSVDDPIARNFQYTETTPIPEQTCANCKLYTGGDKPTGGCPLFGAKQVVAEGWCKAWVAK